MKHSNRSYFSGVFTAGSCLALFSLMSMSGLSLQAANDTGKVFATPEEAVAALKGAVNNHDTARLKEIFGPGAEELENPDRVQATNDLNTFGAALNTTNFLFHASEANIVIEVGSDLWPFPVPLVKAAGGWHFDTEAGEQEILNRRVGKNELKALSTMRAYVDAQREYASKDRDGDGVLEYAQRLASSPGKTDGLYWPADESGNLSPLGPLVAVAQSAGYFNEEQNAVHEPEPFEGYYFKILTSQGKNAPGGKYNYIINGNMIAGFALVAWPAEYGDSGIMTFIVNQQGRVYQKDLGAETAKVAKRMKAYDPDPTWKVSPE